MVKPNQSNDLNKRRGVSALAAITLTASLAAFGCTTNLNPGAGTPTRITPDIRTTPTGGAPIGTENAPPVPPPMTSSYTRQEVMPNVSAIPRSLHHTPDEAAAIMAGNAPLRGRYLGVVSPGAAQRAYVSDRTAALQQLPPYSTPEQTINSSIVSPPTTVVSSGAGTVDSSSAAVIGAVSGTPTPTAAATLPTTTALTTLTPSPTTAITGNATVTAASVGTVSPTTAATTVTPTATTTATPTVTSANSTVVASSPVRIERSAAGTTVTNTGTSARNQ